MLASMRNVVDTHEVSWGGRQQKNCTWAWTSVNFFLPCPVTKEDKSEKNESLLENVLEGGRL